METYVGERLLQVGQQQLQLSGALPKPYFSRKLITPWPAGRRVLAAGLREIFRRLRTDMCGVKCIASSDHPLIRQQWFL
jgi:hypothetical protein